MACNLSLVLVVRDDSMSMDSDQDSSDNSVAVTAMLSHVVTEQQPSLAADPPVSDPALQHRDPSETPKELDFKALSEAISQFKASKMLAKSDAGEALETSFRVDPHQSFLGFGDLSDSYPHFSSETHSSTAHPETSNQTEPAVPIPGSVASGVEASGDVDHRGGAACVFRPATPTAAPIPEIASSVMNSPEPWEQTSPISVIDTRSGPASNGSSVSRTGSLEPLAKNQCGILPTPTYGMDGFYPGLQGSGFMSATHQPMGLTGPRFASHSGAVGLGHPLLNSLGLLGPPGSRGFLPNNVQMAWNSSSHVSASSGLWAARFGTGVQQIQSSPFLQNWQRDAYRPDRGGFGSW